MRLASLVVALAACSSSAGARPAWPRAHARDRDGGESLAPRPAARAIMALVEDDRPTDKPADKVADKAAARPAADKPADKPAATAPAPTEPAADDPLNTEELVIEIEE